MFTLHINAGVASPQICPNGVSKDGYIRISGAGTRRFVFGSSAPPSACRSVLADQGDDHCPKVSVAAFAMVVAKKMKAEGIETGIGAGVCAARSTNVTYDTWNYSVIIGDWKDANRAAKIIANELGAWGMGHYFGLSVAGPLCVVPGTRGRTVR